MKRTRENATLDSLNGKVYPGYTNKEFYLHGYSVYFEKDVCLQLMESIVRSEAERGYEISLKFDEENDCFVFEDILNGDGKEYWKGGDVDTEDGVKHLYPFGQEWCWDINSAKILKYRTIALIYPYFSLEAMVQLANGDIVYANISVNDKGEKVLFYEDSNWTYKKPMTEVDWGNPEDEYYILSEKENTEVCTALLGLWNANPVFDNRYEWKDF